jgi:hypothetical protein
MSIAPGSRRADRISERIPKRTAITGSKTKRKRNCWLFLQSANVCIMRQSREGRDRGGSLPGALVNELGFKYIGYVDGR